MKVDLGGPESGLESGLERGDSRDWRKGVESAPEKRLERGC
jgi:hypothetical protein